MISLLGTTWNHKTTQQHTNNKKKYIYMPQIEWLICVCIDNPHVASEKQQPSAI